MCTKELQAISKNFVVSNKSHIWMNGNYPPEAKVRFLRYGRLLSMLSGSAIILSGSNTPVQILSGSAIIVTKTCSQTLCLFLKVSRA